MDKFEMVREALGDTLTLDAISKWLDTDTLEEIAKDLIKDYNLEE